MTGHLAAPGVPDHLNSIEIDRVQLLAEAPWTMVRVASYRQPNQAELSRALQRLWFVVEAKRIASLFFETTALRRRRLRRDRKPRYYARRATARSRCFEKFQK